MPRFILPSAFLIALAALCIGAVVVQNLRRGPDPEQSALTALIQIPLPPDTVIVDQQSGWGGGSDERCYAGAGYGIYGSTQAAQEIIAFYREFAHKAGLSEAEPLVTNRGPTLRLQHEESGHTEIEVFFQPPGPAPHKKYLIAIPDTIIEEALSAYPTTYWIELTYIPEIVLAQCGR